MPDVPEQPQDREKRLRQQRIRELLARAQMPAEQRWTEAPAPVQRSTPVQGAEMALALERGDIPEEWVRNAPRQSERERARDIAAGRQERRYRQIGRENGALAEADARGTLDALNQGAVQGVTLGWGDELYGAGRAATGNGGYESSRDQVRRDVAQAQAEHPDAFGAAQVLGSTLPALVIPGSRTVGSTAGAIGQRVLQAGAVGAGFGGVQGLGSSQGDVGRQARDTLQGAGYGAAFGAGGQALGEIGDAVGRVTRGEPAVAPTRTPTSFTPEEQAAIRQDPRLRALSNRRDEAIAEAASQRVQGTAGAGSTTTDVQRAADYPGGLEGLADDIREFGIVRPEDTTAGIIPPSRDLAQQRARFLVEDAGERIGAAERRMNEALVDELPGLDPPTDPALVDLSGTARRLRQQASQLRANLTPQSVARANELEELARRYESAGRVPYGRRQAADLDALGEFDLEQPLATSETTTTARRLLDDQRAQAGFGRRAPDASRPWAEEQSRDVQRYLREDMDAAMRRTLTPEEYAAHQLDRRQYGAGSQVRDLGGAADVRRRGNRQVPLSDNIQIAGADGFLNKVKAFVANRLVRGREHAFAAAFNERQARAIARDIAQQLDARGLQPSRALMVAARTPRALGLALREHMTSSPEGADDVAEAIQRNAPEVVPETDPDLFTGSDAEGDVPDVDPDLF